MLAFAAGVMLNLRRGRTIACGCFGSDTELISGYTLLRLGTLLSAVIVLACLHGLTAAHEIIAGDALDEPAYLVEVAGIAVVGGLLTLWALNAQSVGLMVRSFRTGRHTLPVDLGGRPHVIAAKSGLVGLTRALAHDLAADRINVNCVVPGLIDTVRKASSSGRR